MAERLITWGLTPLSPIVTPAGASGSADKSAHVCTLTEEPPILQTEENLIAWALRPSSPIAAPAGAPPRLADPAAPNTAIAIDALVSAGFLVRSTGASEIVLNHLKEARKLLMTWGGTKQAAMAYEEIEAARQFEYSPLVGEASMKKALRAARDVLVLRCCYGVDHRNRDIFLRAVQKAFDNKPLSGDFVSQVLHAYNTLHEADFVPGNQLIRTRRRPRV